MPGPLLATRSSDSEFGKKCGGQLERADSEHRIILVRLGVARTAADADKPAASQRRVTPEVSDRLGQGRYCVACASGEAVAGKEFVVDIEESALIWSWLPHCAPRETRATTLRAFALSLGPLTVMVERNCKATFAMMDAVLTWRPCRFLSSTKHSSIVSLSRMSP